MDKIKELIREYGLELIAKTKEEQRISLVLSCHIIRIICFKHNISLEVNEIKEKHNLIIQESIDFLYNKSNIYSLYTSIIQLTYESICICDLNTLRLKEIELQQEMNQLVQKIVQDSKIDTLNTIEKLNLYDKIYHMIVKLSNNTSLIIFNDNSELIDKELDDIIESIFPNSSLTKYLTMLSSDQDIYLKKLIHMVQGIRLYNWKSKKGGYGLINLPKLITNEINQLQQNIRQYQQQQQQQMISNNIEHHIYLIQFNQLLNQLIDENNTSLSLITDYINTIYNEIDQINILVELTSNIPKEQVFPKFYNISMAWKHLSIERKIL